MPELEAPWKHYRRTGLSEMRPYVPGEDLGDVSVSEVDRRHIAACQELEVHPLGYIARNPNNHADQWYVAQGYFDKNLEAA